MSIVGKTETENIGIDKLIKNTITNPAIRFLILAGSDPEGHFSGKTILALFENGVDENMRVVGSPGRRPVLKNVTLEEVTTFTNQVRIIDMIGSESIVAISRNIEELEKSLPKSYSIRPAHIEEVPRIKAGEPKVLKLDKAGYFVIIPEPTQNLLIVEHYSNDNKLLHAVEGEDARSIYFTVIENGWISELSHAAYLGKELEKAELSMRLGFKYVQDGM